MMRIMIFVALLLTPAVASAQKKPLFLENATLRSAIWPTPTLGIHSSDSGSPSHLLSIETGERTTGQSTDRVRGQSIVEGAVIGFTAGALAGGIATIIHYRSHKGSSASMMPIAMLAFGIPSAVIGAGVATIIGLGRD